MRKSHAPFCFQNSAEASFVNDIAQSTGSDAHSYWIGLYKYTNGLNLHVKIRQPVLLSVSPTNTFFSC